MSGLAVAATIARRELRGGVRGFRVFLACLVLGVAAIAAVGLVREAIRSGLADQGAELLGGDARLEFTYRAASAEERAWIEGRAGAVSEVVSLRSMAGSGDDRALTQLKAVDDAYPLIGALELDPPVGPGALAGAGGLPGAFLDPLLADRLGLAPGDRFTLGGIDFVLMARLLREPDSLGTGMAFGPRSIVSLDALRGTALLAPGALYETEYRVTFPQGTDLAAEKAAAVARFEGAGMRWADSRRASPAAERFTDRLGSFLVLVGLAGLAVGGVGISATVAGWLERKAATVATLRALGASGAVIRGAFLIQLAVLTALGLAGGVTLGAGAVWAASGPIAAALPFKVEIALSARPLAEAALYGALIAAIFALWPLARMSEMRAALLYRASGRVRRVPPAGALVVIAALGAVLLAAAVMFSGLKGLTLAAFAAVAGALLVLALVARGVRWLARRAGAAARGRPVWRTALAAMGAPRSEAGAVIVSLGLGLSVLAAVGQVDAGLRGAIARDLPKTAPAFFAIDIQPDQLAAFRDRLTGMPDVTKVETAPMLRGVITEINGRPAREVAGDHWVLRGDRGVTYAEAPREVLTEGAWWAPDYAGPPLVSVAAKEAGELGLKLGDRLTVNILGRDIEAEIASFRAVDFATMGIGFVLTFNPAALSAAPHSALATIYAPPAAEAGIMRALAQEFPNVTAIGVRETIGRVSEALGAIARATLMAAGVTLVTGFVVLIGAAASGEAARAREAALLKTLGATRGMILGAFALRAALMGAAAGVVAIGFGGLAGWAVVDLVMGAEFRFAPASAIAIVAGGVVAVLAANLIFARGALGARPAQVLRAPE